MRNDYINAIGGFDVDRFISDMNKKNAEYKKEKALEKVEQLEKTLQEKEEEIKLLNNLIGGD